MGKKLQGTNLRILSIAYASGRIDRDIYLKLRTQQLGALEFNKPIPPLPEALLDINVPSVKLDAPYTVTRSPKNLLLGIALVLLALTVIGGGFYAWQNDLFTGSRPAPAKVQQSLNPQQIAIKLITTPEWTEQDLETFTKIWSRYSIEAKINARGTDWYRTLENEAIQRINKLKLLRSASDDENAYQTELNRLRIFYAELAVD
jgi:hypothetical protein